MAGLALDGGSERRRKITVCGVLLAATAVVWLVGNSATVARANGNLPPPSGEVILVVKGAITQTNVGAEAHLDREQFESIGVTRIVTRTPWTDGDAVFEGVLARDLMKALGATGASARAVAANNYRVTLPLSDFEMYDVLLAVSINGEILRLRTKGPIWVIYPDNANISAMERDERMIWQLVELCIE